LALFVLATDNVAVELHRLSQNKLEGMFGRIRHRTSGSASAMQTEQIVHNIRFNDSAQMQMDHFFNLDSKKGKNKKAKRKSV
jgi:hypothetical protein